MGSSQKEKAANHERIVAIAAARIRQDGLDGVSVAEIMREAGLTHGGFYRHFESRDELIAEAVARALRDGSVEARMAPETLGSRGLRAIVYAYLSQGHRDSPATGCAIAALAEDMSRVNPSIRDLYGAQVEEDIELLAGLDPISEDPDSHLDVLTLSALVGALSIARAVGDPALSRRVLRETADALMAVLGA
jgi:TetR/AcrR family transcriptional regulator, transcriptional repressor for nem operon